MCDNIDEIVKKVIEELKREGLLKEKEETRFTYPIPYPSWTLIHITGDTDTHPERDIVQYYLDRPHLRAKTHIYEE